MNQHKGRLYVIGTRETGVLFVNTNPLRAAMVSKDEIARYAAELGIGTDAAFARIAAATKTVTAGLDGGDESAETPEYLEAFQDRVEGGGKVSDVAYCSVSQSAESGMLYIVGDKASGIFILRTMPLRSATIAPAEIADYAAAHGIGFDAALNAIAENVRSSAGRPYAASADFCMQAAVEDADWSSARRISVAAVEDALDAVARPAGGNAGFCLSAAAMGSEWSSAQRLSVPAIQGALESLGNADFCLAAGAAGSNWSSAKRMSIPAIEGALETLNSAGRAAAEKAMPEVMLRDYGYGVGAGQRAALR